MAKLTFLPSGKIVKVRPGMSIIQAARSGRIVIPQRCGGHASCLMCKIKLEGGEVTPPSVLEKRKMNEHDLAQGFRLACQAKTCDTDCIIRIPENKLKSIVAAALKRQEEEENEWL